MSLESYYFNISREKWVRSFDEPTEVDSPIFGNTDARDFGVTFLKSIGEASTSPVQVVQSVVSAQVYLAAPTAPETELTSATAGTAVNNEFPFVLAITGFGSFASGFMQSATTPQRVNCEFRLATAAGVNRYNTSVYIRPNASSDVTADTSAADPALGKSEAKGIYVPKEWPVGGFMIIPDAVDPARRYKVTIINKQWQYDELEQ